MNLSVVSKLSEEEARVYFERIRWPNGPVCPHCSSDKTLKLKGKTVRPGLYKCHGECGAQFSATIGTILEDTHLPIRTWLMAFAIMCSSKKGVSALQLKRQLGIGSYKSAWHLAHRIRHAMSKDPMASMLQGPVSVDEAYVGGKPRKYSGKVVKRGRGTSKFPIVALVERGGRARVCVPKRVHMAEIHKLIRQNVDASATIMTDEANYYNGIGKYFEGGHHFVTHSHGEYVRDGISTNEVESFFALLKRGVMGSFHHISKKHLDKYCDEFAFRWNRRKISDGEATHDAIKGGEGKRLMYKTPVSG